MPPSRQHSPIEVEGPPPPPSETVLQLRKNYKLAAISQFVQLFKQHVGLEFTIEDLEADLEGRRPNSCVPTLLGKLLNTLANDRNVNASNWMSALRRQYNRRRRDANPFSELVRIPIPRAPIKEEQKLVVEQGERAMDEEKKVDVKPTAAEPVVSSEVASVPSTSELEKPVEMEVDGALKEEVKGEPVPVVEEELDYYLEPREIDWSAVSLETKVDAIYDVVEWHMADPERFRRHLKFDDELAWRLDPIGRDAKKNEYYHTLDNRLWIKRAPPPGPRAPLKIKISLPSTSKPSASKSKAAPKSRSAPKKAALASTSRAPPKERTSKRVAEEVVESPRKRGRRERDEVWEEIPEELLQEWEEPEGKGKGKAREESVASSGLTSLGDEEEEEEEMEVDDPEPEVVEEQDIEEEEENAEEEEEEEEEESAEVDETEEDEYYGMMQWEKDYWTERARCDKDGFVEWEAVCVTLEEWEAFPTKFAKTKDRNERALRDFVQFDVLPVVVAELQEKERERIAQIAVMNRKRSSRIAFKESAQEEETRIAAERAENSARLSRASRHKIIPNLGVAAGDEVLSESGKQVTETREERLKKREDEKLAKQAAIEEAAMVEAHRIAREEAIAANGGVVPPGMETPEELAAMRIAEEKEAKRLAREAAKRKTQLEKKKLKAEKMAQKKRDNEAALLAMEEDPWYLDCQLCGKQGWNQDDGSEIVGCDICADWQHISCHALEDQRVGRPPVDYATIDFKCERCRADPTRKPRPVPVKSELLPPPAPVAAVAGPSEAPVVKEKRKYKPRQPKLGPDGLPLPPKPKKTKAAAAGLPAPGLQGARGTYAQAGPASQAYSNGQVAPAQAQAQGLPGPGKAPLDYPTLLALIKGDPSLIAQLPPTYQQHFSQLLNIPLSSLAALPRALAPQPTPVAAANPRLAPASAAAPAPAPTHNGMNGVGPSAMDAAPVASAPRPNPPVLAAPSAPSVPAAAAPLPAPIPTPVPTAPAAVTAPSAPAAVAQPAVAEHVAAPVASEPTAAISTLEQALPLPAQELGVPEPQA